jgi:hypothetical protein
MSKKNILLTEHVGTKSYVTFDTADGQRKYEYQGNSAKALRHGTDPGQLKGKLIEHKKPQK